MYTGIKLWLDGVYPISNHCVVKALMVENIFINQIERCQKESRRYLSFLLGQQQKEKIKGERIAVEQQKRDCIWPHTHHFWRESDIYIEGRRMNRVLVVGEKCI